MTQIDRFGPWVPGVGEVDRIAGLRVLRALVLTFARRDHELLSLLRSAEVSPESAEAAFVRFEQVPAKTKRHILATYGETMRIRVRDRAA